MGNRYKGTVKIEYRYFASDAFLISKSEFEAQKGFDESFRHYGCEDEEFGARLRLSSVPFFFCSDALLYDNDTPTLDRACERMIPYARYSVPLLVKKHPEIVDKLLFPQAERKGSMKSTVLRVALSCANSIKLNKFVRVVLNKLDNRNKFKIRAIFYKLVLAMYYIEGYSKRERNG